MSIDSISEDISLDNISEDIIISLDNISEDILYVKLYVAVFALLKQLGQSKAKIAEEMHCNMP